MLRTCVDCDKKALHLGRQVNNGDGGEGEGGKEVSGLSLTKS
jgi:hypothetical protein